MRETEFINQNKEKWLEFEKSLKRKEQDPEKLSELFVETTDDLSFSRTYYPNRSVRVYLNGIAQSVFQNLYKTNRSKRGTFGTFWRETLPNIMWYSRKQLLWSFIIFMSAIAIGMWSSHENPDFVRAILGDTYVQMTEANIESGDPMAVYKNSHPVPMFLQIMWNNIYVSFLCFILGILAGTGTVMALLGNGIMVGAFLMFFVQRDLMRESLLAIMLHGTIELSMIVLAGCAGFALASGIVFPKNYNRLQSLVISARRGIVIMIGVSAFLVISAAIEGFATRHTETPDIVRGIIIVLSLVLVVGYFVIYPRMRFKKGLIPEQEEEELQADKKYKVVLEEIKTNGKIFTEVFYYFKSGFSKLSRTAIWGSLLVAISIWLLFTPNLGAYVLDSNIGYVPGFFDVIWVWNEVNNFVNFQSNIFIYPLLVLVLGFALIHILFIFKKINGSATSFGNFMARNAVNGIISSAIFLSVFFLEYGLSFVGMILIWPIIGLTLCVAVEKDKPLFSVVSLTFNLLAGSWGKLLGLFFVLISVPWILCLSLSGGLWKHVSRFIEMNIPSEWSIANELPWIIYCMLSYFILCLSCAMFMYGHMLFYHSLREVSLAGTLRSKIAQIGYKPRAYGMEKE